MRVLSIDLDYIMYPTENIFSDKAWDNHPLCRWHTFYAAETYTEEDLFHDEARLQFLKDLFSKAIKSCSNVKFGYEHDDIIYYIRDSETIELINIDHHDDVLMSDYEYFDDEWENWNLEMYHAKHHNRVNEGNWIAWLEAKGKLESFTWIGNHRSISDNKHRWIAANIQGYNFYSTMNYDFGDAKFDHIFMCLSPQYIPPHLWHHFTWFWEEYERQYNTKVNPREWENRKVEIEYRYKGVSEALMRKTKS